MARLLVAALFLASTSVCGLANEVVDIWPDAPPKWNAPSEPEVDTSGPDSNKIAGRPLIRLGNVSTPQLHLYPAKNARASVIICPGGGYHILAWDLEGTEIAEWFQANGVSAAVLKYRVPSAREDVRWLAPVQDVQRSISMVRNAGFGGFPTDKVGILGFSAGGHACVKTATAQKRHYDPVDKLDRGSVTPDFAALIYPGYLTESRESFNLSPDIVVTEKTPPMFIAHAYDDRISCLGLFALFTELKNNEIPSSLHIFSKGGHGFGGRTTGEEKDSWLALCKSWMRDQGWVE